MRESEYLINMNADIEQTIKNCSTCLEYQPTKPQETALYYDIPCKTWMVIGADIVMVNNKTFCIL